MTFDQKLALSWKESNSLLCVGLDPDSQRLPEGITPDHQGIVEFGKRIVDATAQYACSFKPQIAYYHALSAEKALEETIAYIKEKYPSKPIILDSKRGDIGATAKQYAIEAFERYQADAVTVNPYMGWDTIEPFACYQDKGVILLCRTSNDSASELQNRDLEGEPLFIRVAENAAKKWNKFNNISLVVGATAPSELAQVRKIVGDMPILVPGVGSQGGDAKAVIEAGLDSKNTGLIVNSSRAILYASSGSDFAEAAALEAKRTFELINQYRK